MPQVANYEKPPKTIMRQFRIRKEIDDKLVQEADKRMMNITQCVNQILKEVLIDKIEAE